MGAADNIQDAFMPHEIDLLRVDASIRRRVVSMLRDLERALIAQLATDDPTAPARTAFQRRRLEVLLEETQQAIQSSYRQIHQVTRRDFLEVAEIEEAFTRRTVNAEIGGDLMRSGLSEERLVQLVDDSFVSGGATQANTIRGWWEQQAGGFQARLAASLRQGMLQDETVQQLIRRIRGTRAAQFKDGVAGVTRRNAEMLVRTAVNAVSQQARLETFRANSDVIRGVAVNVTLDTRTSPICISRSGGAWNLADGRPLPESEVQIQFPGPLPWHFNERSRFSTITRTYTDMLRQAKGPRARATLARLTQEERALLDAKPPRQETYDAWLRRQPRAKQIEALGRGKWELWQADQIRLRDLVDQTGRPLTVAELRARAA